MTLDEQIRAKLDEQEDHWVDEETFRVFGIGRERATTSFHIKSDLGACHRAIRAAIEVAEADDGCWRVVTRIAEVLNIQQEEP